MNLLIIFLLSGSALFADPANSQLLAKYLPNLGDRVAIVVFGLLILVGIAACRLRRQLDDIESARPRLVADDAICVDEPVSTSQFWDTGQIVTASGVTLPEGNNHLQRVTTHNRVAQVARLIIRNSPVARAPTATAKDITASIEFIDPETGEVKVRVRKARWSDASARTYPDSRIDQTRMDFGIEEPQSLDIAFKWQTTTMPFALDDRAVTSVPNWEIHDYRLIGTRFIVAVRLSGVLVDETLHAELRFIRPDESQAGHIEFTLPSGPGGASGVAKAALA